MSAKSYVTKLRNVTSHHKTSSAKKRATDLTKCLSLLRSAALFIYRLASFSSTKCDVTLLLSVRLYSKISSSKRSARDTLFRESSRAILGMGIPLKALKLGSFFICL